METAVTPASVLSTLRQVPNERALVAAARRGDVRAFNELVRHSQGMAYRIAYRVLGDPTLAEDATQDAFVQAFRQVRRMDDSVQLWLLQVVIRRCMEHLDRRSFRTLEYPTALTGAPDPAVQIQKGLAAVPPGERVVCVLADMEGLSHQEIAWITGVTLHTVKRQLASARTRLRDVLCTGSGLPTPELV
jgi:RNA polymerase sigma-70 factor, ECF subfamily